jgi:hypothetical protein
VEELDKGFTGEEDYNYVMGITIDKTTSSDGIPAEMWKQFCKTNDFSEY